MWGAEGWRYTQGWFLVRAGLLVHSHGGQSRSPLRLGCTLGPQVAVEEVRPSSPVWLSEKPDQMKNILVGCLVLSWALQDFQSRRFMNTCWRWWKGKYFKAVHQKQAHLWRFCINRQSGQLMRNTATQWYKNTAWKETNIHSRHCWYARENVSAEAWWMATMQGGGLVHRSPLSSPPHTSHATRISLGNEQENLFLWIGFCLSTTILGKGISRRESFLTDPALGFSVKGTTKTGVSPFSWWPGLGSSILCGSAVMLQPSKALLFWFQGAFGFLIPRKAPTQSWQMQRSVILPCLRGLCAPIEPNPHPSTRHAVGNRECVNPDTFSYTSGVVKQPDRFFTEHQEICNKRYAQKTRVSGSLEKWSWHCHFLKRTEILNNKFLVSMLNVYLKGESILGTL